ncbi:MFS transporter [Sphingomonas cavernae]|uniref:MFS transporter n=1 Tax=Sphingomonas cavernae TaxID=2320861 RepID=UPI0011C3E360|nr:MFS transporter [Sphingomonas cavernae]
MNDAIDSEKGPWPGGPSEWKSGARCLVGAIAGYATGFGFMYFSANLFIQPMREEFGWTASEATFLPITTLVMALLFPVSGHLVERFWSTPTGCDWAVWARPMLYPARLYSY